MILANQREFFDIPNDIIFLNCAYMSPLLKTAGVAGNNAIENRKHPWKMKPPDWFEPAEELKQLFANIINADRENIALIPSASYGIAVAANNIALSKDQSILLLDQEYPSNVYAWRELAKRSGSDIITVKREAGQSWVDAVINKLNSKTGIVSLPNCHWADGSFVDLERISNEVRRIGAKLVVDASQSIGAFPFDVEKIKPDFLITVGYKWLLGPHGLSYLYADKKYFDEGKPIEFAWADRLGSEDFSKLVDYTNEYKSGARRFDAGAFSSFIHMPMAKAALTQINEWGVQNIQATLSELTNEIENNAKTLRLETPEIKNRVGHMIGIKLPPDRVAGLSKTLIENKVFISFRGASMRIAPYLYNDKKDIQKLFSFIPQVVNYI